MSFCIVFLLLDVRGVSADETNILFIGNSYTNRHNIPSLVEQILEQGDPGTDIKVSRVIYGGQNMFKHSSYYFSQSMIQQAVISDEEIQSRIDRMQEYLDSDQPPNPAEWNAHWDSLGQQQEFSAIHKHISRAIANHKTLLAENPRIKWDYVVLQSWRDVSQDANQGYAKYASVLAKVANASGAEVILYMTSPETQNQAPVDAAIAVSAAERDVLIGIELVKRLTPKAVVHVPLAIRRIQQNGTELCFRYVNDGHPNQTCAFLTTNLFYAALTGKSPQGLSFATIIENKVIDGMDPDGGPPKVVFTGETKRFLQRAAFESTLEFNHL